MKVRKIAEGVQGLDVVKILAEREAGKTEHQDVDHHAGVRHHLQRVHPHANALDMIEWRPPAVAYQFISIDSNLVDVVEPGQERGGGKGARKKG